MTKLGSEKKTAVVRVQNQKRAEEIALIFSEHNWKYFIGIEPDKPENISDLEKLLYPPEPIKSKNKISRDDLCPCGSGKKYKKCCG